MHCSISADVDDNDDVDTVDGDDDDGADGDNNDAAAADDDGDDDYDAHMTKRRKIALAFTYNDKTRVKQRFSPHEIKHSTKKDKHYIILVKVKLPNLKAETETAAFPDICYINASSLDLPCKLTRK